MSSFDKYSRSRKANYYNSAMLDKIFTGVVISKTSGLRVLSRPMLRTHTS